MLVSRINPRLRLYNDRMRRTRPDVLNSHVFRHQSTCRGFRSDVEIARRALMERRVGLKINREMARRGRDDLDARAYNYTIDYSERAE